MQISLMASSVELYNCNNYSDMDFRVRPSSKKSQQSERSLVQLPAVRGFQPNGSELRSVFLRLESLESNFSNYQDLWRRERDIANAGFLETQKRIDMLEYKTFTNQKDVKQVLHRDMDAQLSLKNDGQIQSIKAFNQSEITVIKQALVQQRDSHREYAKHQSELLEQLNRRQMRMESEIRELLTKQRDDYDHRLSDQLEEIRNNENIKQRKIENQYELMKSVISNTEKKIFSQFERKLRNETVIKDFIEDKLAEIRQEMAAEQRAVVSKQSKFIREIKQSIQSIFAIIKNTQKELTQELAETQKLSANNLKRLSATIELIKQKHSEDLSGLAAETSNLQSQIQEIKQFVNLKMEENREMLMEMEEDNFNNSKVSKQSRPSQDNSLPHSQVQQQSSQKIQNMEKEFNNWKATTEQKNLNVFKEISNTLKVMKLQWRKENDQITSEIGSFKQSLMNVKKSVPLQIKKSIQTIITVFNNEFDTLAQELDTISDLIALSKKQTEKLLKEEIKRSEQDLIKEMKELIKTSNKEMTLQIEKTAAKVEESMKMHAEQQIKFVKDLLIQKYSSLQVQINQVSQFNKKNSLNTTAQLEDFTLKLKSFNENFKDYIEEQRKEDMKKRIELEESMRKNANNLMEIYYKKCEFLVDGMKKAIEMNILKDMATMKRDIELVKQEQSKNVFQTKQELINQMNEKIDKMNEQRESSEEVMHEAFDNQLNTVRKNLSNEIGNSKLEMGEKINELIESVNEMKQKGSDSTQDLENTVQMLKEAIWKMEAMSFAEQAKNKALIDKMGQDLNDLSLNLTLVSNELKPR